MTDGKEKKDENSEGTMMVTFFKIVFIVVMFFVALAGAIILCTRGNRMPDSEDVEP